MCNVTCAEVVDVLRSTDELTTSKVALMIDEYIFNERDRNILKRRLLDGITYERLAEEFDMSVRQIKNIVYKGEKRVFK